MSAAADHANGWACIDCLMLLANGETSPEWSEAEEAEYLARVESHSPGRVTLGRIVGESGCECSDWDCDEHRESCERESFSWSACDVCGSRLGGERAAVTFWLESD